MNIRTGLHPVLGVFTASGGTIALSGDELTLEDVLVRSPGRTTGSPAGTPGDAGRLELTPTDMLETKEELILRRPSVNRLEVRRR